MKKRNFIMTEMENARNKDEEAAAVSAVYGRIERPASGFFMVKSPDIG